MGLGRAHNRSLHISWMCTSRASWEHAAHQASTGTRATLAPGVDGARRTDQGGWRQVLPRHHPPGAPRSGESARAAHPTDWHWYSTKRPPA
eukprot:7512799-Heterocapsa_arctica.AAC.1